MLGLFKKNTKGQTLQKEYHKLMQECYRLSSINRSKSDAKFAEAELIADKIQQLKKHNF